MKTTNLTSLFAAALILATPLGSALMIGISFGEAIDLGAETTSQFESSLNPAADVPVIAATGGGAYAYSGLVANWMWTITIYAPIGPIGEPGELPELPSAKELADKLVPEPEVPGCTELAVGSGAAPLVQLVEAGEVQTLAMREVDLCENTRVLQIDLAVEETGFDSAAAGPINTNVPDVGEIELKGSCAETRHGNGFWKKATYSHTREIKAVIDTVVLQAHLVGAELTGSGSGKCVHQHDTSVDGTAAGTILTALPVVGTMSVTTDGAEISVGDWVGGSIDIQAHASFHGRLDLPAAKQGYYSIHGSGDFLGA